MKLSTMTNFYYKNTPDKEGFARALRKTHAAGFDAMDFCMCPMQRNDSELCLDDWEYTLEKLVAIKEELSLDIAQSHLPYPVTARRRKSATDPGCEQNEFFRKMTERAVRISGALGVKWAVVHPAEYETLDDELVPDKAIEYNKKVYGPVVELASSLGVGIAFENMADPEGRRFGVSGNELVSIMEAFNDPMVGVCWDFGHANRVFKNQVPQLKAVAPYLRATHVDDNIGKDDLHTIPFFGTIDWRKMMPLLKEIGYEGCFNYELAVCKRMPEEMLDSTVKYIYEMGRYLLTLAE